VKDSRCSDLNLNDDTENSGHTIYKTKTALGSENGQIDERPQAVTYSFLELQKIEIDPTYKVVLNYNMACCYQRLHLYEECAEYLENSTHALKERIKILDQ